MKTQEENQKLKKENDIYKSFICHVKNSFKMINDDISEIDVYRSLRARANDILNNKAERLIEIGAKYQEDVGDKKYDIGDFLSLIEEFREKELPNRNTLYHYEAEIEAGLKHFEIFIKGKTIS